jgi:hypothetical protein
LELEDDAGTFGTLKAGASVGTGDCEKIYKANGNSVQHLLVMAFGLTDGKGRNLAEFEDDEAYKTHLNKAFAPKVPLMKAEMKRRAEKMGFMKFRKSSVLKPEAMQWLKMNPVNDPRDIEWLMKTEKELYKTLLEAVKESQAAEKEKLINSNWTGNLPWLRLYCCMTHDDAKQAMLTKDDLLNRDELDARNSDSSPETYEEAVARLYNDPEVEFYTEVLPGLHETFARPICSDFSLMPGGSITAEDTKKKIGDARAKLLQVRTVNNCRKDILAVLVVKSHRLTTMSLRISVYCTDHCQLGTEWQWLWTTCNHE